MERKGFALHACPVKSEVDRDDPIEVRVVLENVSDTIVNVRPLLYFGNWLNAEIVAPDGSILEPEVLVNPRDTGAEITLLPGESIEKTIDIRCPLGPGVVEPDNPEECLPLYRFEQEGVYRVQVRYSYLCEGRGCPPGELEMNEIRAQPFEISIRGGAFR